MTPGQYGFSPKKRKEGPRYSAQLTIRSWLMGRRHLVDDIDLALHTLGLGKELSGINKRQMIAALQGWVQRSPHLPKDLQEAIILLVPEVGQGTMADDWPPG